MCWRFDRPDFLDLESHGGCRASGPDGRYFPPTEEPPQIVVLHACFRCWSGAVDGELRSYSCLFVTGSFVLGVLSFVCASCCFSWLALPCLSTCLRCFMRGCRCSCSRSGCSCSGTGCGCVSASVGGFFGGCCFRACARASAALWAVACARARAPAAGASPPLSGVISAAAAALLVVGHRLLDGRLHVIVLGHRLRVLLRLCLRLFLRLLLPCSWSCILCFKGGCTCSCSGTGRLCSSEVLWSDYAAGASVLELLYRLLPKRLQVR